MNLKITALPLAMCALLNCAVAAEPSETAIEEVIVVASKTPRPINTVAANVSVLTQQDIDDNLVTSANNLFEYTSGIDTETAGTRFGAESISIRGIGGNRVSLLVDGVPLGDQFDIGSFSNATRDFINAGLISRAEILHGPASTMYGSDAIGGVVALYTPTPDSVLDGRSWGGRVSATYQDADNSKHLQASIATGNDSLAFIGSVGVRDGQQFDPVVAVAKPDLRDYQRQSVLLKLVANELAGQSWKLSYLRQQSDTQSNLKSMLGSGRFRSTTSLTGDDQATMNVIALEYDLKLLQPWFDKSVLRVYRQHSDFEQDTYDERLAARKPQTIDRFFSYKQRINGAELNLQKEMQLGDYLHRFGLGLEYQDKNTEEFRDASLTLVKTGFKTNRVLGEQFPLRDFPISDTSKTGAYFEYTVSSENWTAIAALRADKFKLRANTDPIYLEDNPTTPVVSLSESDLSPKLGLIYHANDNLDLYLQYAHGFRAPPFEDANIGLDIPIFKIRAIPNPDLKSESSDGFDLGLRWIGERARFNFGVFHTDYQDFIETKVRLGRDPASGLILFQSQNLSETQIKGIEAGWQIDLSNNFDFMGSLYVAEGENKQSNTPLNSVGPEQLILGLGWRSNNGIHKLRLRSVFTGAWDDLHDPKNELFKPESYSTVDLFYSQEFKQNLKFRVGLRNLGNKQYWQWSDVRGFDANDPVLPTLARPGRQFSASVEMSF